jgi:hypothetical protein
LFRYIGSANSFCAARSSKFEGQPSCRISSTVRRLPKTAPCTSSSKRPAAAARNSRTPSTGNVHAHEISSRRIDLSARLGLCSIDHAEDGDPLDVMVIHDAATFPGLVLACRIIGILQIEQRSKGKAERNDRLFAVPRRNPSEVSSPGIDRIARTLFQPFLCKRISIRRYFKERRRLK